MKAPQDMLTIGGIFNPLEKKKNTDVVTITNVQ